MMMKILHPADKKSLQISNLGIVIKRGVIVLFLVLIILINAGCGLENITVLNAPSPGSLPPDETNHTITFLGTAKNNEIEFKGFDLYYKFYKSDDYQSLQDDMNLTVSNPSDLVKKGFFKIVKSTDTPGNVTEPLISIPPLYRGTEYTITIDFSGIFNALDKSDPVIYADNPSIVSDLSIKRGVTDTSGFYKSFYDYCFSCPDLDLANISDVNPSTDSIRIAFYAFSYGSDFENTYYSNGCYLGYLTINLGLLQ